MLTLTNEKLTNIYGEAISTLPNFSNYSKLFKFINILNHGFKQKLIFFFFIEIIYPKILINNNIYQ